jgi:hypothetical protein
VVGEEIFATGVVCTALSSIAGASLGRLVGVSITSGADPLGCGDFDDSSAADAADDEEGADATAAAGVLRSCSARALLFCPSVYIQ